MPISYGDGGTKRDIIAIYYQDGANLRMIKEIWYGDGGTKRLVYTSLSVSAPNITGGGTYPVSGTSTVSVDGGVGPFTYATSVLSGGPDISFTDGTTATLTATTTNPLPGTYTATVRRIVTDSYGAVATADHSVSLQVTT